MQPYFSSMIKIFGMIFKVFYLFIIIIIFLKHK